MRLPYFLFAILFSGVYCEGLSTNVRLSSNPSFVIRVSNTAIDPLINRANRIFVKYAPKISIPDMKATISGIEFETENARITNLEYPLINYKLMSPNKVKADIELPSISLQTDFKATRHVVFIGNQQDGGTIKARANNVKVSIEVELGQNENGQPTVRSFDCRASLGPSDMRVLGAKHRYATEVLTLASKGIQPLFNTQACRIAKKIVNRKVKTLLDKIPDVIRFRHGLAIKFQVQPIINEAGVAIRLFEKVLTSVVSPYDPAPFKEEPNGNSMLSVSLSDALINDLLYQGHENKLFQFTVDKHSPSILYSLLSMDCTPDQVACLGNQMPSLVEKYGRDADAVLAFKTITAPEVEFSQDKATFKTTVSTSLDVQRRGSEAPEHEATATVNIAGDLKVKIDNDRIYGNVTLDEPVVNIDQEDAKKYEEKISDTIKRIVETHVNGLLIKGLPLRLPFGIRLTDPLVQFSPHTLQAHTGFDLGGTTITEIQEDTNDKKRTRSMTEKDEGDELEESDEQEEGDEQEESDENEWQ